MPINKPGNDEQEISDYRIQLSFDGARCSVWQPRQPQPLPARASPPATPAATPAAVAAAGDRVLTPWLTVIGRHVDGMPLVEVTLRRAGDELTGAHARVRAPHTCARAALA